MLSLLCKIKWFRILVWLMLPSPILSALTLSIAYLTKYQIKLCFFPPTLDIKLPQWSSPPFGGGFPSAPFKYTFLEVGFVWGFLNGHTALYRFGLYKVSLFHLDIPQDSWLPNCNLIVLTLALNVSLQFQPEGCFCDHVGFFCFFSPVRARWVYQIASCNVFWNLVTCLFLYTVYYAFLHYFSKRKEAPNIIKLTLRSSVGHSSNLASRLGTVRCLHLQLVLVKCLFGLFSWIQMRSCV